MEPLAGIGLDVPMLIIYVKLNLNNNSKYFNNYWQVMNLDNNQQRYIHIIIVLYMIFIPMFKAKKRNELMVRPIQTRSRTAKNCLLNDRQKTVWNCLKPEPKSAQSKL